MTWPTKKITDVCDLERGTEPGSAFYIEASDKSIPFLRVGDLTGKVDAPKFVKNDNGNLRTVNENETLITFDGTPGIVVRGFNGAIASGIRVVRNIKPEVDGNFLFYYLQTPGVQKTIKAYSKGATIIHASSAIEHIKIPLPPLKIQKQIVERLDKIVEAQKLNDGLIQKADELFQSLLHKELNPAGKDWKIKKIKDVAVVKNGGTPNTKNSKYWNGKVLWLTPKELSGIEDMEVFDTERKISDEGLKHSSATFLPTGTVLLTSRAPIGYIAIAGAPMATNQGFKNFICNKKLLDNKFLYFFLRLKTKYLQSLGRGATFTEISKTTVEKLDIPIPPLKIQKQIVAKLSAAQEYKTQLLAQKNKLKELFDSVLHKSMQNDSVLSH